MVVETSQEFLKVATSETPPEGFGDRGVVLLELKESTLEVVEAFEVIRGQRLALQDGEVDLDLVEPAGVDRGVHHKEVRPLVLESALAGLASVRGAVVYDPEDAPGGAVGLLGHDLLDQSTKGSDPRFVLTPTMDLCSLHIPRRKVSPRTESLVFVLDEDRSSAPRWLCGMAPVSGLDARFLVSADDTVIRVQRPAFPEPLVEIQHACGLDLELGIAGKDPTPVPPRLDRILRQPPPQGGLTDGGNEAAAENLALEFRDRVARQGQAMPVRQFTRQGLDGDDDAGGKSELAARREVAPEGPRDVAGRTSCATC